VSGRRKVTKPPDPICSFRVYPNEKGLYFRVFVFETVREMYRWGKACCFEFAGEYDACTVPYKSYPKASRRVSPELGQLCFAKPHLGAGVQAHEAAHAALTWLRRLGRVKEDEVVGLPNDNAPDGTEELYAGAVGEVARQLNAEFTRRGLYE
jgi:hypothetical protein